MNKHSENNNNTSLLPLELLAVAVDTGNHAVITETCVYMYDIMCKNVLGIPCPNYINQC